ncbi:MAG: hypothetical protein AB7L66_13410 [Gemmatimonadales bacterium]
MTAGIPRRARGWAVASLATASVVTVTGLGLAALDSSRPSAWILALLGLSGVLNSAALLLPRRRAARILTITAFLPPGGAIVLLAR